MKVKKVYESWKKIPGRYIIETTEGELKMLDVRKGFRQITEKDLKPYFGTLQALELGLSISEVKPYLYRFYGLEKE